MVTILAGRRASRSLSGRVAVVTGATAGIGRRTAIRLAERGATVVAVARHEDALARLADEADGIVPHQADVVDDDARAGIVQRTLADFGQLDVLVNNLGIGWAGPFEHMDLDQIRSLTETNLVAPMDLSRLALETMLRRGHGDIVLIASAASWFSMPPLTVYSATKYGLEGFGEGLRREFLARGVRVHSIHPGPVRTEFAARAAGDEPGEVAGPPRPGPGVDPERVAMAVERILLGSGAHMRAVPRVLGVTRLMKVPPLQQLGDRVVALGGARLARWGRQVSQDAAGPYER